VWWYHCEYGHLKLCSICWQSGSLLCTC
jgi:hypothetical protein